MHRSVVTYFLVATIALSAVAADGDSERAVGAVQSFNDRLAAGDGAGAATHLGPSLFIGDERTTGRNDVSAHFFRTGADVAAWPAGYLREVGPHVNTAKVVSVSIRGNAAVVTTSDTGSNRFRKWKNEQVVWLLGRMNGTWQIVGIIYRDIQLPK